MIEQNKTKNQPTGSPNTNPDGSFELTDLIRDIHIGSSTLSAMLFNGSFAARERIFVDLGFDLFWCIAHEDGRAVDGA